MESTLVVVVWGGCSRCLKDGNIPCAGDKMQGYKISEFCWLFKPTFQKIKNGYPYVPN